jgi:drug/metabolite transporter (DMT)-like permease
MARQIGGTESATVMAFYQNLVYLLGALALAGVFAAAGIRAEGLHPSLAFLVRPWTFAHPGDIGLLLVCGPIAAVGTVFLSHAYRIARANFAAPFEYTGLIWAACWGYFFFGETPDPYMIAGAALIIGAGLTMLGSGRKG